MGVNWTRTQMQKWSHPTVGTEHRPCPCAAVGEVGSRAWGERVVGEAGLLHCELLVLLPRAHNYSMKTSKLQCLNENMVITSHLCPPLPTHLGLHSKQKVVSWAFAPGAFEGH